MTILNLPAEQADTAPRELWEGEAEGLAEAAAAVGRRAADWVRYLPVPVTDRWTGARLPTPSRWR
ncbi:hypothetical protein ADK54_30295 [Streptomyces sp. WM6378]|nr:hypothetical protein ADK54_30295 [Streptomyces sp. WM6378]